MAEMIKCTVINPVGLYATPATELVNLVKKFNSQVTLYYEDKHVNLKSMMGVLSLGIPTKANLEIIIEGEDEKEASKEIIDKFNKLDIALIPTK